MFLMWENIHVNSIEFTINANKGNEVKLHEIHLLIAFSQNPDKAFECDVFYFVCNVFSKQ